MAKYLAEKLRRVGDHNPERWFNFHDISPSAQPRPDELKN